MRFEMTLTTVLLLGTQLGKPMNPHLPDLFAPLDAVSLICHKSAFQLTVLSCCCSATGCRSSITAVSHQPWIWGNVSSGKASSFLLIVSDDCSIAHRSHAACIQAYPFGTIAEHGLYFISFSCSLKVLDEALDRMLGNKGGGTDNIFKVSVLVPIQ